MDTQAIIDESELLASIPQEILTLEQFQRIHSNCQMLLMRHDMNRIITNSSQEVNHPNPALLPAVTRLREIIANNKTHPSPSSASWKVTIRVLLGEFTALQLPQQHPDRSWQQRSIAHLRWMLTEVRRKEKQVKQKRDQRNWTRSLQRRYRKRGTLKALCRFKRLVGRLPMRPKALRDLLEDKVAHWFNISAAKLRFREENKLAQKFKRVTAIFSLPILKIGLRSIPQGKNICNICLETLGSKDERGTLHDASKLPCGCVFGTSCIISWLMKNSTCPLRCEDWSEKLGDIWYEKEEEEQENVGRLFRQEGGEELYEM